MRLCFGIASVSMWWYPSVLGGIRLCYKSVLFSCGYFSFSHSPVVLCRPKWLCPIPYVLERSSRRQNRLSPQHRRQSLILVLVSLVVVSMWWLRSNPICRTISSPPSLLVRHRNHIGYVQFPKLSTGASDALVYRIEILVGKDCSSRVTIILAP